MYKIKGHGSKDGEHYVCKFCDEPCHDLGDVRAHLYLKHNKQIDDKYKCKNCKWVAVNLNEARDHKKDCSIAETAKRQSYTQKNITPIKHKSSRLSAQPVKRPKQGTKIGKKASFGEIYQQVEKWLGDEEPDEKLTNELMNDILTYNKTGVASERMKIGEKLLVKKKSTPVPIPKPNRSVTATKLAANKDNMQKKKPQEVEDSSDDEIDEENDNILNEIAEENEEEQEQVITGGKLAKQDDSFRLTVEECEKLVEKKIDLNSDVFKSWFNSKDNQQLIIQYRLKQKLETDPIFKALFT